ncbi:hypothetical protein TIFTF001_007940 [Ficus carica]|uniref:RNase H type-1 domain-containing protein n=1 Tax=Ficus carica TaxID=3494 RepID=A0AA88D1B8_FICCA|nr:hypothetical protein TIFTF001_007940 [Ficus carica]
METGWNHARISELFLSIDRELILSIPLSVRRRNDYLVWHFDPRGIYTVRSGYHLEMEDKLFACSSSGSSSKLWWKKLWAAKIPNKIKIHACVHSMVLSQPKLIWPRELATFGWRPHFDMCWNDSKEGDRNKRVFEGRWDSARGVIERAGRLLGDYLMCNGIDGMVSPKKNVPKINWRAPAHGCIKLNVYVAIDDALGFVGECLAVKEGTWFALSCGYPSWIAETDAMNVCRAVSSLIQHSIEANAIADIRNLCLQVRSGFVCYGSRKGNSIAYFLVRLAITSLCSRVWIDCLPKFLGHFVRVDIVNLE